jgi:hypothetical protein
VFYVDCYDKRYAKGMQKKLDEVLQENAKNG